MTTPADNYNPDYRDPAFRLKMPQFDYGDGFVGIYFADAEYTATVSRDVAPSLTENLADGYLQCTGPCLRVLPRHEFDKNRSVIQRGGKGYRCTECRAERAIERRQRQEKLERDRQMVQDKLTCPDCTHAPFQRGGALARHVQVVHGSKRAWQLQVDVLL